MKFHFICSLPRARTTLLATALLAAVINVAFGVTPAAAPAPVQSTDAASTPNAARFLFVDARVEDAAVIAHAATAGAHVVRLDAARDGLEQIAERLDRDRGAAAVGIVAHGAPGTLRIGTSRIDEAALAAHAPVLVRIRDALAPDAVIQLYACNTAAGASGLRFVRALAQRSGHEVAASDRVIGADGDWDLAIVTGGQRAAPLLDARALREYAHDLELYVVTNGNDSGAGSLRDLIAAATAGDVIRLPLSTTVHLTSGQLTINKNLVIEVATLSTSGATIDAGYHSGVIAVTGGPVALRNLLLRQGRLSGNGGDRTKTGGAALGAGLSNTANLTLANVPIMYNAAAGGGGGGCDYPIEFQGTAFGAGGGGGGGFNLIGGGNGGTGSIAGTSGANGFGGHGGQGTWPFGAFAPGGDGGYITGGAGGSGPIGPEGNGNAGATASLGLGLSIGGGGGGSSYSNCVADGSGFGTGGIGGAAAGGLYNAGTIVAFGNTFMQNNLAAAGGSSGIDNKPAGWAAGAVYNKGTFSITAAGAAASASNVGAGDPAKSTNTFLNDAGTMNLAYTNAAPVIGNLEGDAVNFTQGDAGVYIDAGGDATLADADSPTFFGGFVFASVFVTPNAEDQIVLVNQGGGPGQIGVSGNVVSYSGVPIGVIGPGNAFSEVAVTFSSVANATPAAVQAVLRALAYTNTNTTNPDLSPRTLKITVDDGHGGRSTTAQVTVNLTSSIGLTVDDHRQYARYGEIVDYTVTLANIGNGTASGIAVTSAYPFGLDGASAQWSCVPANGASCNSGSGAPFADTATLPPQSSATWIVNVPVPLASNDATTEFDVSATGAQPAGDVDVLVLFRDDFEG